MFTVAQIKEAHAKVKSGADFPNYIQDIKKLGVTAFETWVFDSHTEYFGKDEFQTNSEPMYAKIDVAEKSDKEKFSNYLKIHQKGETDYTTFCRDCAATGNTGPVSPWCRPPAPSPKPRSGSRCLPGCRRGGWPAAGSAPGRHPQNCAGLGFSPPRRRGGVRPCRRTRSESAPPCRRPSW